MSSALAAHVETSGEDLLEIVGHDPLGHDADDNDEALGSFAFVALQRAHDFVGEDTIHVSILHRIRKAHCHEV